MSDEFIIQVTRVSAKIRRAIVWILKQEYGSCYDKAMFDAATNYCEQMLGMTWEPINTVSSAAFMVAGVLAFYVLRNQLGVWRFILPALLVLVGLGSSWWHIGHTPLGDMADSLVILGFACVVGWIFLHQLVSSKLVASAMFFVLALVALLAERLEHFNGSLPYVVLWFGLAIGSIFYVQKYPGSSKVLSSAVIAFGLAIICRTVDMSICSVFSSGSHFLWHMLTALFGLLITLLVVKRYVVEE